MKSRLACPKCGERGSKVIATRRTRAGVTRRRECRDDRDCRWRWTTREVPVEDLTALNEAVRRCPRCGHRFVPGL